MDGKLIWVEIAVWEEGMRGLIQQNETSKSLKNQLYETIGSSQ